MVGQVKPATRDDKPNHVVLHARINYLWSEKKSNQIRKSIIELTVSLIMNEISVIVSGILPGFDNISNKTNEANDRLVVMCGDGDIPLLSHSASINSCKHLSKSKLHLNFNGKKNFCYKIFSVFEKF